MAQRRDDIDGALSPGDVQRMLGIGRDTLRRWVKDGKVPYFTLPSGVRRFHRRDIEALIQEGTPDPETEAVS